MKSCTEHEKKELDPYLIEAIDWVLILDSGHVTLEQMHAFDQWLAAKPEHQQAWNALSQTINSPFEEIQQQHQITNVPAQILTQTVLKNKRHKQRQYFASISLGITALAVGVMFWILQIHPLAFWYADYYTKTAEVKTITLEDGSQLTLNAYSAIRVDYTATQRDIYLLHGSIIANVAPNKQRPFIVHTEHATMQAMGTKFMVQQSDQYSDLAVLEHTVRIKTPQQIELVSEDSAVRASSAKIYHLATSSEVLASWKYGIVEVHNVPLTELIEQIRPYHKGYIYLSKQAAQKRVYGVFYLNDTQKILEILASTQSLQINRIGSSLVYIDLKK